MRRRKREIVRSLALEIVVAGIVLYVIGSVFYQRVDLKRLGQRSGIILTVSTTVLQVRLGWG